MMSFLSNYFLKTFHFSTLLISDNLRTDYQFTFNLSKPDDQYYTGINFMNIPVAVSFSQFINAGLFS